MASSLLPNRVAPDGALFATPERGLLMGNRGGRFHDNVTRDIGDRRHATRQWICCVLAFKGRQRQVWSRNTYTELFFCDEVTALAAGHRPCMECRRADALAYRRAIAATGPLLPCPELDRQLDRERRNGREKRSHRLPAAELPDGVMYREVTGNCLALKDGTARLWSPAGYAGQRQRPVGMVEVLTPPTSIAALAGGFKPLWHDTVFQD